MNVGIPGTGIGGIFYLLSAFLIFISELIALMRGRRSNKRWKVVIKQLFLTFLMITMATITNYYFSLFLFKKRPVPLPTNPTTVDKVINLYQNHPLLIPITLLFFVLLFVQMSYLFFLGRKHMVRIMNQPTFAK